MQGKIKSHLSDSAGIIELHLSSIKQLFNSFDRLPFHEKELDAEAERYLIGRALELRRDVYLRLVVTVSRPSCRPDHEPEPLGSIGLTESPHFWLGCKLATDRDLSL